MSTPRLAFLWVLLTTGLLTAQQPDRLLHSIPPPVGGAQTGAMLGSSMAVDGGYVVAGVPFDDVGGRGSGVVKVFNSATGALLLVIPNPSPAENDYFGWSVGISGTRVVVGAIGDSTGANRAGSVYVYDLAGGTPTLPVVTLNHPAPALSDHFGYSVAISGTRVVVGANGHDAGAHNAGGVYVYDVGGGTPTVPTHKLNNPSPASDDQFGNSVGISGTRVVVGALWDDTGVSDAGSAYVYDLSSGTPTVPVHTLNNPGPAVNDRFGVSVAISGTRLVVSAFWDDTGATDAGSAYVYDLSGGTPTVPVHTLNNPDPAMGDQFGNSVAISGTRVVVGSNQDATEAYAAGRAYVYELASATPTVPMHTLHNPSPARSDQFGTSVAISGTQLVVGTPLDDTGATDAGSAYVYDLSSGTPTMPVVTLNNPGPMVGDRFSTSVAISGTRLVVGAPNNDVGAPDAGSAYVYDLSSGTPTLPVFTLNNPSPVQFEYFGISVAISGSRVVIGSHGDDTGATDAGRAYVYDLTSGTPSVPVHTLNNPSPAEGDSFGWSVAISGTRVVIGTFADDTGGHASGCAYVYDLSSGTPTVPVHTLNNPSPAMNDMFGYSVGISGPLVVVGTHQDDTGALNAGSAYVYDLSSGTPTLPVHTLNNPGPATDDAFGFSVGISGTDVVVGARYDDTGAPSAGSAYVYDLGTGTPTVPVASLNNPSPEANDRFGWSVAISGTRVVIGAYADDTGASDAGSAYVYELGSGTPTVPVASLNNPGPASGDNFGYSVAVGGGIALIGTPFDDSVIYNKGYAYTFDLVTTPPVLTAPSVGLVTASPISVSFTLPEAALPGSVKLAIGAAEVTLSQAVESAGTHSFTFDPAHPTHSPEVASGGPVADGTYTVTLSYQDAGGNAAASASANNVTVDTTGPLGGTVSLSPGAAVTPSTLMSVDFAGWLDDRQPLSYSLLVDDVVVSAAGPGSSRNFTAPSFAGAFTLKARITDSLGNTTTVLRSFHTGISPQTAYDNATTAAGLTGPDAQATAILYQGDVSNLLKYAFNLDLTAPDRHTLVPGSGTAGLPVITVPSPGVMRVEYVRRVGSGLVYTPQKRSALDAGVWQTLTAPPQLTPIDTHWERIHHDEPFNPLTTDGLFGSVEVTLP